MNTGANDPHFQAIDIIRSEQRFPDASDCNICYHPKLWYAVVAYTLELFPFQQRLLQKLVAQLINCISGIAVVYFFYRFLKKHDISERIRFYAFSLFALNPAVIGITVQATNDAFVICFATISIYGLYFYIKEQRKVWFWISLFCAILATLSKFNGIVLFLGTCLVLLVLIIKRPERHKHWIDLLTYASIFVLVVSVAGSFVSNYQKFGSFVVHFRERAPMPGFFIDDGYEDGRLIGVRTVLDSYFTFRWIELIRYPQNRAFDGFEPLHRTSLWTQIYGSGHSVHFLYHPESWKNNTFFAALVGGLIFLFALPMTILIVYGLCLITFETLLTVFFKNRENLIADPQWTIPIFVFGFLGFLVAYTLSYRNQDMFKAIFIFPGLLCFLQLFLRGLSSFLQRFQQRNLIYGLELSLLLLLFFYAIDTAILTFDLTVYLYRYLSLVV